MHSTSVQISLCSAQPWSLIFYLNLYQPYSKISCLIVFLIVRKFIQVILNFLFLNFIPHLENQVLLYLREVLLFIFHLFCMSPDGSSPFILLLHGITIYVFILVVSLHVDTSCSVLSSLLRLRTSGKVVVGGGRLVGFTWARISFCYFVNSENCIH